MLILSKRGPCSSNYTEKVLEKIHYHNIQNKIPNITEKLDLTNDWETTHDLLRVFNKYGSHDICNSPYNKLDGGSMELCYDKFGVRNT